MLKTGLLSNEQLVRKSDKEITPYKAKDGISSRPEYWFEKSKSIKLTPGTIWHPLTKLKTYAIIGLISMTL